MSRDNSRTTNKLDSFFIPVFDETISSDYLKNIPQPVAVNIGVNMVVKILREISIKMMFQK